MIGQRSEPDQRLGHRSHLPRLRMTMIRLAPQRPCSSSQSTLNNTILCSRQISKPRTPPQPVKMCRKSTPRATLPSRAPSMTLRTSQAHPNLHSLPCLGLPSSPACLRPSLWRCWATWTAADRWCASWQSCQRGVFRATCPACRRQSGRPAAWPRSWEAPTSRRTTTGIPAG